MKLNVNFQINQIIFEEPVHAPMAFYSLRDDYDSCWDNSLDSQMGYWLNMTHEWVWVVNGCVFKNVSDADIK